MQAFEVVKAALLKQEAERMAHDAAMEKLGITIQLSAEDVRKLKAEWEADHNAGQPKRDFFDALLGGFGQFVAEWNARKEARKKKS
jgi:hypothetical protein